MLIQVFWIRVNSRTQFGFTNGKAFGQFGEEDGRSNWNNGHCKEIVARNLSVPLRGISGRAVEGGGSRKQVSQRVGHDGNSLQTRDVAVSVLQEGPDLEADLCDGGACQGACDPRKGQAGDNVVGLAVSEDVLTLGSLKKSGISLVGAFRSGPGESGPYGSPVCLETKNAKIDSGPSVSLGNEPFRTLMDDVEEVAKIPMKGVDTGSSLITHKAKKWKKLARSFQKHFLGPSSPVQKLLAARRKLKNGSCSSVRRSPIFRSRGSVLVEVGGKRKCEEQPSVDKEGLAKKLDFCAAKLTSWSQNKFSSFSK
ncbi:hypothetical protein ACOSQ3_025550 [Xanthoceras sorbifolium]